MKKYKGEVTNEIKLQIEIDDNIWDDDTLSKWRDTFFECYDTQELAIFIAESIMRNGVYSYHEGFGFLKVVDWEGDTMSPAQNKCCNGITVVLLNYYEDGYIEADLMEVE